MTTGFFSLLGQPIESSEVQKAIDRYQLQDEFKDIDLGAGAAFPMARFSNEESYALVIAAKVKVAGGPKIVDSILIYEEFAGEFPFQFDPSTPFDDVNLGKKMGKSKSAEGIYSLRFMANNYTIAVSYLNNEADVLAFRCMELEVISEADLLLYQFNEGLVDQKPHLVTNLTAKQLQQIESPLTAWFTRMKEGDSAITEAGLLDAQGIISELHNGLVTAAAKKSPSQILAALKKSVLAFNKLNKKHANMIETSEREELVPYFEALVAATGLQVPAGLDLTLQYRDW
jgi:hypothetical protein